MNRTIAPEQLVVTFRRAVAYLYTVPSTNEVSWGKWRFSSSNTSPINSHLREDKKLILSIMQVNMMDSWRLCYSVDSILCGFQYHRVQYLCVSHPSFVVCSAYGTFYAKHWAPWVVQKARPLYRTFKLWVFNTKVVWRKTEGEFCQDRI